MSAIDAMFHPVAAANYGLITRQQVLAIGGSDDIIRRRVQDRRWIEIHAGVYQIGARPLDWTGRLKAATLAGAPHAVASHRAAAVLWQLEGIQAAPIEITIPYTRHAVSKGVIVHRTRRWMEPTVVEGIPVTPVERTILDIAWGHPSLVVEQLYDSARRQGLTTAHQMAECVYEFGKWGVRGVGKVVRMLDTRRSPGVIGSPAESSFFRLLVKAGIEPPVCQHMVLLPDGSVAVIDFAWPHCRKGVEVDGLEAHASAHKLESDLRRQNLLFEVQWQLRRFSGRQIKTDPGGVAESVARFLAA